MEDIYDFMEDEYGSPEESFNDYNSINDGHDLLDSTSLGMALSFAEMISEENNSYSTKDPAEMFEDYEDTLEKISLKDRNKSKVPVPAFEQYVYNKCGI